MSCQTIGNTFNCRNGGQLKSCILYHIVIFFFNLNTFWVTFSERRHTFLYVPDNFCNFFECNVFFHALIFISVCCTVKNMFLCGEFIFIVCFCSFFLVHVPHTHTHTYMHTFMSSSGNNTFGIWPIFFVCLVLFFRSLFPDKFIVQGEKIKERAA